MARCEGCDRQNDLLGARGQQPPHARPLGFAAFAEDYQIESAFEARWQAARDAVIARVSGARLNFSLDSFPDKARARLGDGLRMPCQGSILARWWAARRARGENHCSPRHRPSWTLPEASETRV